MYSCKYCQRKYTRNGSYERHILTCELLNKTPKEIRLENEERDDTPTFRQLYEIILEMGVKYAKLEKKVEQLSKYIGQKKKIQVLDWLKSNHTLKQSYSNWINTIQLTNDDLELIFAKDFIEGVNSIIFRYLPLSDINNIPIRSFEQKIDYLCIFENNEWIHMSDSHFQLLLNTIIKQLMTLFNKWQDDNIHKLKNDKSYLLNVQKLLGCNSSKEKINKKIHNALYKHLKMNLKNLIEYEFDF